MSEPIPFSKQPTLYLLVRTTLGLTFLWASVDKILNPAEFAGIIMNYDILPPDTVNLAAVVLPWFELVCGLLLVLGRLVPGATLSIVILLFTFMLATGFSLYRGLDINCGCFSVSPDAKENAVLNLARNSLLLAAGAWLFAVELTRPIRDAKRPPDGAIKNAG
jgi:putative oxidoreductase